MKIILSPAKEMNLENPIGDDWQLTDAARPVVESLQSLTKEQLQHLLKVSDSLLQSNQAYIDAFKTPITYEAMDMYHGLAFRSLKQVDNWRAHLLYLKEHVRILSAVYGAVSPVELVKPYRLDMTMPLKVNGQSLKRYWKEQLPTFFEEGEVIVNLASQEFSSLLCGDCYQWIGVEFYEEKDGRLKSHSTISKKGRGLMAGWMMQREVCEIATLRQFDLDGYKYQEDLSTEKKLCFVKRVK